MFISKGFGVQASEKESGRLRCRFDRNQGAQGECKFYQLILYILGIIAVSWFLLDVEWVDKCLYCEWVYYNMGLNIATLCTSC